MRTKEDRYAARCVNFVLVASRIAVLAARSAAKDTGNRPRGRGPWLVLLAGLAAAVVTAMSASAQQSPSPGNAALPPS